MKKTSIILTLFVSYFFYSCKEKKNEVITPIEQNLIQNSSFESSGNPDFTGWAGKIDSIEADNAPNGGKWALQLSASNFPKE